MPLYELISYTLLAPKLASCIAYIVYIPTAINQHLKTTITPLYQAMKENYQFSDAVKEYLKLKYTGSLK